MRNRLIALALVGLAGQVFAGGLFISEYYEGAPGVHKALELYNGSTSTIDLSTYSLVAINNGGSATPVVTTSTFNNRTASSICNLGALGAGLQPGHDLMLAPGETFTLFNSAWTQNGWSTAAIPAFADAWGSSSVNNVVNFNGNDAIALCTGVMNNFTVVDVIGVELLNPGPSWTIGGNTTGAVDHDLVRHPSVCEGTANWSVGQDQWIVYPNNTYTNLGSHASSCFAANVAPVVNSVTITPQPVTAGTPLTFWANVTDDSAVESVLLYYGNEPDDLSNSVILFPQGGDIFSNDNEELVPAPAACTNLYYQVVAMDDDGESTTMPVQFQPVLCQLTIHQIQGEAATSPYVGSTAYTQGVVTAVGSNNFFLQDGPGAWNGIYVYSNFAGTLAVGDLLDINGVVTEYFGLTELNNPVWTVLSQGNALPAPMVLTAAEANNEAYEGVLVRVEAGLAGAVVSGEVPLTDETGTILVDNQYLAPAMTVGECYTVQGPLNYTYNAFKIAPASMADIVACPVEANETVASFELGQAYPNPFNPTATIAFSMDRAAQARLSVYNVAGQEVAVLANGLLEAGEHHVVFEAANLPSGLYLYSLRSEGRQLVGRMALVR